MALLGLLSSRQVTFSKATTSLAANGFTSDLLNVTVTVVVTVHQIPILISNLLFNSIFNEHSSFSFLDFRFYFCKFYVISSLCLKSPVKGDSIKRMYVCMYVCILDILLSHHLPLFDFRDRVVKPVLY